MQDSFPLHAARIASQSPHDVGTWPIFVGIRRVVEGPTGFGLQIDDLPSSWSNQFVVWAFVKLGAPMPGWLGTACFLRQHGEILDLPAIFGPDSHDGVAPGEEQPGSKTWFARVRELQDYVPQPGDKFGIMLTSPNGHERSNLVVFTLPADDTGEWLFDAGDSLPATERATDGTDVPPPSQPQPQTSAEADQGADTPSDPPPLRLQLNDMLDLQERIVGVLNVQSQRLDSVDARLDAIEKNLLDILAAFKGGD